MHKGISLLLLQTNKAVDYGCKESTIFVSFVQLHTVWLIRRC